MGEARAWERGRHSTSERDGGRLEVSERMQDERRTGSLSIVVPVYRSEETLPELHRRLTAALDDLGREY